MTDTQVLILAGGVGKRMWPIVTPKNLLPFFGKPLFVHTIDSLKKAGFEDFILVVSPEIKNLVKVKARIATQKKPLGQADAILSAKEQIRDAPLLIVNANDFFEQGLFKQIKERIKNDIDALLVGLKVKEYFPGGYLVMEKNLVKKIIEKPGEGNEPSDMARLVVDYFRKPKLLFKYLNKAKKTQDAYEKAMSEMMKAGIKFGLVEYQGSWATIKYPWDILKMTGFFLKEKKKKPVVLEKGVKILEGAVIRNSYIGKNTIIGNNALVRDSIIEENCVIGYNTEVVRSYVGPHCWFHANYIGDSVLEENVSFGSGARTANLRLDEKEVVPGRIKLGAIIGRDVRIGINTSIMPGVLVGSGSFVGPGLVLEENLEGNKFCYLKQKLVIKKNIRKVNLEEREKFKKRLT